MNYSGDCRPSQDLQRAGDGCDLLIHEATFGDSLASDASEKRHCTTSEAVAVAANMRAKHTVLTHFSQRYSCAPQVMHTIGAEDDNGGYRQEMRRFSVAFDFMEFCYPSQMQFLPEATEQLSMCLSSAYQAGLEID